MVVAESDEVNHTRDEALRVVVDLREPFLAAQLVRDQLGGREKY